MVTRPDFTPAEHDLGAELLRQRFGGPVSLAVAGIGLQLDADSDPVTACATLCWQARGVDAIVCASGRRPKRPGHGLR